MARSEVEPLDCEGLLELVRSKRGEDRQAAIRSLAVLHCRSAVSHLVDLLDEGDEEVRITSARALGVIGGTESSLALQRVEHGSSALMANVAEALGNVGDPAAAPALERLLDGDLVVRRAAAEALKRAATSDSVPALSRALTDEQWTVRSYARRALAAVGTRQAIEALRRNPRRTGLLRVLDARAASAATKRVRRAALSDRVYKWNAFMGATALRAVVVSVVLGLGDIAFLDGSPLLFAAGLVVATVGFLRLALYTETMDTSAALNRAKPRPHKLEVAGAARTFLYVFSRRTASTVITVAAVLAIDAQWPLTGLLGGLLAGLGVTFGLARLWGGLHLSMTPGHPGLLADYPYDLDRARTFLA